MDEEYWCMQWCGEVLPEPAMIPDLGVFLRSTPAYAQVVTAREQSHAPTVQCTEEHARKREPFPARLKLPFLLTPSGENKAHAPEQQDAVIAVNVDKR